MASDSPHDPSPAAGRLVPLANAVEREWRDYPAEFCLGGVSISIKIFPAEDQRPQVILNSNERPL
jgi:hypothetical protein